VVLRPEAWARQISAEEVVGRIIDTVAAPTWT
jgi:hypothetical protein